MTPSAPVWKEFWKSLDQEKVWEWRTEYPGRSGARAGYDWSLAIVRGTKKVTSRGLNAYPNYSGDVTRAIDRPVAFHRLWRAIDRLAGRSIDVEGQYFSGFEASVLTPETPAYRGQRWWFEGNKDLWDRYAKLLPPEKTDSPFKSSLMGGPEIWVRLRGRLVGPGGYGHLGFYEYQFITEEVIDMKPSLGPRESKPPP